jgi:hypothetical protein
VVVSARYGSHAHVVSLAATIAVFFETERVNSVWTTEKLGFSWIALNVFPSGVGPSAWHELKILLWVPASFLILLFIEIFGLN